MWQEVLLNFFKVFQSLSEVFWGSPERLWKTLKYSEVFWGSSERLWKTLKDFERLWKILKYFEHLLKDSERLQRILKYSEDLLEDSERLQKILKYSNDLLEGPERFRKILKYSEIFWRSPERFAGWKISLLTPLGLFKCNFFTALEVPEGGSLKWAWSETLEGFLSARKFKFSTRVSMTVYVLASIDSWKL